MENHRRRELIKAGLGALLVGPFIRGQEAFGGGFNAVIELPPFPFQESFLTGEKKGGRVLIVGGIHGNEPGAYKAAEILRHVKVKRGELLIAPRTNFVSILANMRGYNGDMNRKFSSLSPSDPDYSAVKALKSLVKDYRPDMLLTLHDGFGFHSVNPKAWGQCIVIDDVEYKGFNLGKEAETVSRKVNSLIKKREWKIPVYNTRTFSKDTKHPEQRKSLTYYCLKECSVPAICLEVSKQLPDLKTKVKFHLLMLKEFFKLHQVEIEPDFDYIISNLDTFLNPKVSYGVELLINGRRVTVTSSKSFKLPKKSSVKFLSFSGTEGTNAVSRDVNMNLRKVRIRRRIAFEVKDDYKKLFKVRFVIV
jgi:hypothetical protein